MPTACRTPSARHAGRCGRSCAGRSTRRTAASERALTSPTTAPSYRGRTTAGRAPTLTRRLAYSHPAWSDHSGWRGTRSVSRRGATPWRSHHDHGGITAMTVTQPSNPTVRRRVHGAGTAVRHGIRPADGPARRLSSPAISPFRPDPHGGITVRTWHGPADLAEFSRGLPTVVPDPTRFHVQSRSARFGEFDVTYMAHTPLRWGPTSRDFGHTTATVRLVVVLEGQVTLR